VGLMDSSEDTLIEGTVPDPRNDARRTTAPGGARAEEVLLSTLATILYVASGWRARPRAIDHYIDYFGDQGPRPGRIP